MTKVLFKRKTSDEIATLPVEDGAIIYNHETGATYLDYGNERIPTGGGMPTGDTFPIGAITPFGGITAPTNWLICDGSAISRTTYADLFSVIGTSFGVGDGSTTFNLPDLRSRVPLGKDSRDTDFDTIGNTYGEKTHTLTVDEIPTTYAKAPTSTSGGNIAYFRNDVVGGYNGSGAGAAIATIAGGGQAHNIVQPSLVTNYIIKAFQSVGTVANVVTTNTSSDTDTYSCNYTDAQLNTINNKFNYSETEQAIGIWKDGKTWYRTVTTFQSLSSRANNTATINISSLNIDTIIDIKGVSTDKNFVLGGDAQAIGWNQAKTQIIIYFNNSTANYYEGHIIIEYTKN